MTFSVKQGDLVYTTDGTLGFVSAVYRLGGGHPAAGWAAVDVPGLGGPVYFGAQDVQTRDETVPSVLLRITSGDATSADRRRAPDAVTTGTARRDETPPLEIGRPERPDDAVDELLDEL